MEITKEEYNDLLACKEFLREYYDTAYKCPECGTYNKRGYICRKCGYEH